MSRVCAHCSTRRATFFDNFNIHTVYRLKQRARERTGAVRESRGCNRARETHYLYICQIFTRLVRRVITSRGLRLVGEMSRPR